MPNNKRTRQSVKAQQPNKKRKVTSMPDCMPNDFEEENYIASPFDKPNLVSVKSVDLLKKMHGKGLYATTDIPAHTCIGVYTGLRYTPKANKERGNIDSSYLMSFTNKHFIDACKNGNFTRYINFSDNLSNVEFTEAKNKNRQYIMKVITTKQVYAGEQFLVDYNVYNEKYSKEYFFLNPNDGWQSSQEWLKQHANKYQRCRIENDLLQFKLHKEDIIYATEIIRIILKGDDLTAFEDRLRIDEINFPLLKTDASGSLLEFHDMDTFNPLMLACYLGQLDNVKWLIAKGANIDQKQNLSGNCSLFLALKGYKQPNDVERQELYIQCILFLLKKKADLFNHDKKEKTFMHKAVQCLSTKDFLKVITEVQKNLGVDNDDLFNYTDNNDDDIFLASIREESYKLASIIMDVYPKYFTNHYIDAKNADREYHQFLFREIIKNQSNRLKTKATHCLEKHGIERSVSLLKDLGLFSKSTNHNQLACEVVSFPVNESEEVDNLLSTNKTIDKYDSDAETDKEDSDVETGSLEEFQPKVWTLDVETDKDDADVETGPSEELQPKYWTLNQSF